MISYNKWKISGGADIECMYASDVTLSVMFVFIYYYLGAKIPLDIGRKDILEERYL